MYRDCAKSEKIKSKYIKIQQSYFEAVAYISPVFAADINGTMQAVKELHDLCVTVKEGDLDRPS